MSRDQRNRGSKWVLRAPTTAGSRLRRTQAPSTEPARPGRHRCGVRRPRGHSGPRHWSFLQSARTWSENAPPTMSVVAPQGTIGGLDSCRSGAGGHQGSTAAGSGCTGLETIGGSPRQITLACCHASHASGASWAEQDRWIGNNDDANIRRHASRRPPSRRYAQRPGGLLSMRSSYSTTRYSRSS